MNKLTLKEPAMDIFVSEKISLCDMTFHLSSRSSVQMERAKKHEIYAAAFGHLLYYGLFLQGWGESVWELLHCRKNEANSIRALVCALYGGSIGDAVQVVWSLLSFIEKYGVQTNQ